MEGQVLNVKISKSLMSNVKMSMSKFQCLCQDITKILMSMSEFQRQLISSVTIFKKRMSNIKISKKANVKGDNFDLSGPYTRINQNMRGRSLCMICILFGF